jgi:SAM-dependent methyltransferase
MNAQLIENWNEQYEGSNIPQWEDTVPNTAFCHFVLENSTPGMRILELGCGLGYNAIYLAQNGLKVTASDISDNAVKRCRELAKLSCLDIECMTLDLMNINVEIEPFDIVVDKGCLHTFFDHESRSLFSKNVHTLLGDFGLWFTSIGSADNNDDPCDSNLPTYPRLSLQQITIATEEYFEFLKVQKGNYGSSKDRNFVTWECLLRKRANKAMHPTLVPRAGDGRRSVNG